MPLSKEKQSNAQTNNSMTFRCLHAAALTKKKKIYLFLFFISLPCASHIASDLVPSLSAPFFLQEEVCLNPLFVKFFTSDRTGVWTVPQRYIDQLPLKTLRISILTQCAKYRYHKGLWLCPFGVGCHYVHCKAVVGFAEMINPAEVKGSARMISTDTGDPFLYSSVHVKYTYKSVMDVRYPRLPPGLLMRVDGVAEPIPSDRFLSTSGANEAYMMSYATAPTSTPTTEMFPLKLCHAFESHTYCEAGEKCRFGHAITVDAAQKKALKQATVAMKASKRKKLLNHVAYPRKGTYPSECRMLSSWMMIVWYESSPPAPPAGSGERFNGVGGVEKEEKKKERKEYNTR
eukprot:gene1796-1091_t